MILEGIITWACTTVEDTGQGLLDWARSFGKRLWSVLANIGGGILGFCKGIGALLSILIAVFVWAWSTWGHGLSEGFTFAFGTISTFASSGPQGVFNAMNGLAPGTKAFDMRVSLFSGFVQLWQLMNTMFPLREAIACATCLAFMVVQAFIMRVVLKVAAMLDKVFAALAMA